MEAFGPFSTLPDPNNFLLPTPELQVIPDDERLRDLGMTRRDLGLAVQANADGIIRVRGYEVRGELKDVKIISKHAVGNAAVENLVHAPVATPMGDVVDLSSLGTVQRLRTANSIRHIDRSRGITLQLTPPAGMPLEEVIAQVDGMVAELRQFGAIGPDTTVKLAGSAGKLADIRVALMGDGSLLGTMGSSLFLALVAIYLLMVVLFQSWTAPLVILVTVPLATWVASRP